MKYFQLMANINYGYLKIVKTVISLFLFTVLLVSCSVSRTTDTNRGLLTSEIAKVYDDSIFNGFAVSIVDQEDILYQQGFGLADVSINKKYTVNTIQNVASVSKTIVGIALLKAQELGKLNLDEPINKYLPFKVFNPKFPNENITIRQLATHTSSIVDNDFYLSKNYYLKPDQDIKNVKLNFEDEQFFNPSDSIISLNSFLENILSEKGQWNKNSFSTYKPGTTYDYSNIGTALAAYVVEQSTGITFPDFTQKYIFKPLRMKSSGWNFKDVEFYDFSRLYEDKNTQLPYYEMITYPDGGLITSVNDLSRFLRELIRGYNGNGKILSKESYSEYFKPYLSAENFIERNERNPFSESYNVGILIGYGYTGYIGHTGGDPGVLSMMFFNPKTNIGRIMIYNTTFSDKKGNDVFYAIWNLLEQFEGKIQN